MGRVVIGISMYVLTMSGLAVADGSYPGNDGPGSINWPPPGGVSAMRPQRPVYSQMPDSRFRPYPGGSQPATRFQYPASTQQFRNEMIAPPDENWPQAEYFEGKNVPVGELPAMPVQRGAPVEVVPPPGVPVGEVDLPISEKPERGFRPMKEKQELEALEESLTPPESNTSKKPPAMREVKQNRSPLHAPEISKPMLEQKKAPSESGVSLQELLQKNTDRTEPFASGMSVSHP